MQGACREETGPRPPPPPSCSLGAGGVSSCIGVRKIPYPWEFRRLLRLSYDRNGKQYHCDQDWHRCFLHLRLIREFI